MKIFQALKTRMRKCPPPSFRPSMSPPHLISRILEVIHTVTHTGWDQKCCPPLSMCISPIRRMISGDLPRLRRRALKVVKRPTMCYEREGVLRQTPLYRCVSTPRRGGGRLTGPNERERWYRARSRGRELIGYQIGVIHSSVFFFLFYNFLQNNTHTHLYRSVRCILRLDHEMPQFFSKQ